MGILPIPHVPSPSDLYSVISQSFLLGDPPITEKNCPSQIGKVHLITGGYTGCGLELAKILYGAGATVFVAGRSQEKGDAAITTIKQYAPASGGAVEFIKLDLADLTTIKPAVDEILGKTKRLHVLTLNAAVMMPPPGSKSVQGYDLQLGTNCIGHWLLYVLLRPLLVETAASSGTEPGDVRVTWAASAAVDLLSPKPGGTRWVSDSRGNDEVQTLDSIEANYGQSKVGNVYMAAVAARKDAENKIVHVAFNPGNLKTALYQYRGRVESFFFEKVLFSAIYGGYTELFAAVSPDVGLAQSGGYIHPWGRFGGYRSDVEKGVRPESEGGLGFADKLVAWCERAISPYR